jgi:hypothetical protein
MYRLQSSAQAVNSHIRSSSLQAQNVDKCFYRYVIHCNPRQEVLAAGAVEPGQHGEYGLAVFFQQRHRRRILNGCTYTRPSDDAADDTIWAAFLTWANFEPIPGKHKIHDKYLFFPVEFTNIMEAGWDTLAKAPKFPYIYDISSCRRHLMDAFAAGRVLAIPNAHMQELYISIPLEADMTYSQCRDIGRT